MNKKIIFEDKNDNWEIWKKNNSIERSIKRVVGKLPEMEASKQLKEIIKKIYKPNHKILDFGCAAGHYLKTLKKLDKNISYTGFDITKDYIKFAKIYFKKDKNVNFDVQSIFKMKEKYKKNLILFFVQMYCITFRL
jgi:2-polyprenyl-3-methyl-5-hydroxy-6-metoxy-1,4-benzoquinol methylase